MAIHSPTPLNCSPSDLSFEDTYNTLKYADRAKQIKAKVFWSQDPTPALDASDELSIVKML